ncbi:MAG TPA: PilZ domain-containing protein [Candidatus Sulfotelmatobacter sp.]
MEKSFAASALAPDSRFNAPFRKTAARTALVNLPDSSRALLAECFRQYGIETVAMTSNAAERMHKEKYEACVLPLGNGAETVMESARISPSNSRCIIYGLGGNVRDSMRYSKYGINAVFDEPLERPAALKLVRATQMLVLHEFRRYVRIPLMTEVSIVTNDGRRFSTSSIEVSSGGMSVKTSEDLTVGTNLEISFALLTLPRVTVRGSVSWKKAKSFGVRFETGDERRQKLKAWIDGYLES